MMFWHILKVKKNVGDNVLVTVLRNGIMQFNTVKLGSNPNYLPELNVTKNLIIIYNIKFFESDLKEDYNR